MYLFLSIFFVKQSIKQNIIVQMTVFRINMIIIALIHVYVNLTLQKKKRTTLYLLHELLFVVPLQT